MKYKLIYLTLVVFLWTVSELSVANETSREGKFFSSNKLYNSTDLNKIVLTKNDAVKMRNSTLCERAVQVDETNNDSNNPAHFCREPGFGDAIKRCMSERRSKIIENFARGKVIITNCFKAAVIFSFFKYLTMPPNSSIKLFNGVVEFVKISDPLLCSGIGECNNVRMKNDSDKNEYLYGRVVEKIVDADSENENLNADDLVGNSNNGSKNVLWETITNLLDEKSEEEEEEVLKKELTDKKILAALNALSRNYILKINAFSDITMRMKRNLNDKISFSVEETSELLDSIAKTKNESSVTVGHAAPRKLQRTGNNKNKNKVGKKTKSWQKHLKKLLLPFSIQIAILPFFLKNLLFLAVKALLAGKAALALLAFNVIRNAKIQDENYQTRVEHYGYKGEEYGAWINGRKFGGRFQIHK